MYFYLLKDLKIRLDIKQLEYFKYCYHFESFLFEFVMKMKSLKLK